jgi:predicted TIM-barrel enzyme
MKKIVVLLGSGTNAENIIKYFCRGNRTVVAVLNNQLKGN